MRGLRSTIALFVILLGLGAYIYFVESERDPAAEDALEQVFDVEAADVTSLQVVSDGGETTLSKDGDVWTITAPIAARADEPAVDGLTNALTSLEVQRVVEEEGADLATYGLDDPAVTVAFETADGELERRLLIGDETATGSDRYAKVGDSPRVFLISGFLESSLGKSTFDLRDKAVLEFNRPGVESIGVELPDTAIRIVREDDVWRLDEPVSARADSSIVEGLIGRLDTGRMAAVEAEAADDLEPYGLTSPEITVTLGAGSAQSTLLVGAAAPAGTFYAKDASRPLIFTIDAPFADELRKLPEEYRTKSVFDFRSYTAHRVEITRDGTRTVFDRSQGDEADSTSGQWSQVEPAAEVESAEIESLLTTLANVRADSFVDEAPGGATEILAVMARSGENDHQEEVRLVRTDDQTLAVRSGEPGAAVVPAGSVDGIVSTLEGLGSPDTAGEDEADDAAPEDSADAPDNPS